MQPVVVSSEYNFVIFGYACREAGVGERGRISSDFNSEHEPDDSRAADVSSARQTGAECHVVQGR